MRIIDADNFLNLFYVASAGQDKAFVAAVEMVVEDTPTIDAVEVVRCKDCAYYRPSPFGHPKKGWCTICGHHRSPGFYCANAYKKEKKHGND